MPEPIKFPACGGELRRDTRPVQDTHNGQTQTVQQPRLYCQQCGGALLELADLATTRDPLYQLLTASERSAQDGYLSLDNAFDGDEIEPNTETRAALAESEAVERLERLNSTDELF